jgi:hypothetical protein
MKIHIHRQCDERCLHRNDESMPEEVPVEHELPYRRRIDPAVDLPDLQLFFLQSPARRDTIDYYYINGT